MATPSKVEFDPTQFGGVESAVPAVAFDPEQFGAIANIDEERGAPMQVRNAVAAAATPQDKLATLELYYPGAKPWGVDNFTFMDPDTGNQTLFNPKGLDMGDISAEARLVFEFVGGGIGGIAAGIGGQLGPQIALPEELVTIPLAVGVGAATGAKVYDVFADMFYPNVETRTAMEQTSDVGIDVMVNAVGHRAGELLEGAVKTGIAKGSSLAKAGSEEIAKAFRESGVEAMAGAVSGSRPIQAIEHALSMLPASADIIGDKYTKTLDDMGKYAMNIVNRVSSVEGREMTGARVKRGIDSFVTRFQNQGRLLYDQVDEFIPPGTRVQSANFRGVLDDTLEQFSADPGFAEMLDSGFIKQLRKAQDEAGEDMAYSTMKALRTRIGAALDDKALVPDTSQAELKRLYGALSDDMGRAAAEAGDDALAAYKRANTYWNAGRTRLDNVLKPVADKAFNQDVFAAVMSGSKSGSEKLRALKRSIPPDEWNAVVGQQIREMGRATPGAQDVTGEAFSPATFLTNFSRLSKEARNTLFSSREFIGLGPAVDNLAVMSAALKESAKMANTSGTAQQQMYIAMLTGAGGFGGQAVGGDDGFSAAGAAQAVVGGFLAPRYAAKLVTSPKFISWLADGTRTATSGIGAHLTRLVAIAEKNEDLQPAIYAYMDRLSVTPQNQEQAQ